MGGIMRYPALAGSALVKGALQGTGMVGDLDAWTHRLFTQSVFDPLHRIVTGQPATRALEAVGVPSLKTGLHDPVSGQYQGLPSGTVIDPLTGKPADTALGQAAGGGLTSTNLLSAGRAAGVVDNPALTPQTTGEKYTSATAEGVGGMLPYLPLGGTNPASLLRGTFQGAGAGAGGELGAETFPNYPDLARAAGSIGGLLLGGRAFDIGNRATSAARGLTTPAQDAYRNLNIDPTLAGDVTGRPFWQMLQAYGARAPGGAGRIEHASETALGQWGSALEQTADGFGQARTAQEAGTALQREARDWMDRWRQAQTNAEAAVSARVPVTAPVDLTPVNQVLNATTRRMPGLPNVANIHTNPTFQEIRTALATDAPNGVARWEDVRQWRSAVGEELERSLLSRDGNQAAWRRLYGSLSQSLGDTAFANNAHQEWAAANNVTSQGHQFVENVLGNIINGRTVAANTIKPEAAAASAMQDSRLGGTTLQAIRDEMPAAADQLAAYKLRDIAAQPAGAPVNAAGVSPNRFVTGLSPRNLAPEARDALFANDPYLASRLDDLTTVGQRMRATEQYLNRSNTGAHLATGHAAAGVIGAPFAAYEGYREGGLGGGVAGLLGSLAFPFLPGFVAGRLASTPTLTRYVAAPTTALQTGLNAGRLSGATLRGAALAPEFRGLLGP
jgi:hypothetical protein